MPDTRSGRRAASARAKTPPRLWPMIATRCPVVSAKPSSRASSRGAGLLGAAHVGAHAGASASGSRCARSHAVIVASEPSPAMKPGMSSTGRSPPVRHAAAAPDRAAPQRRGLDAGEALVARTGVIGTRTSGYYPNRREAHRPIEEYARGACAPPPSATAGSWSTSTLTRSPRTGRCSSVSAPPASTAPTCSSSPAATRAPRGSPAGHPGPRAGRRGGRRAAGASSASKWATA